MTVDTILREVIELAILIFGMGLLIGMIVGFFIAERMNRR